MKNQLSILALVLLSTLTSSLAASSPLHASPLAFVLNATQSNSPFDMPPTAADDLSQPEAPQPKKQANGWLKWGLGVVGFVIVGSLLKSILISTVILSPDNFRPLPPVQVNANDPAIAAAVTAAEERTVASVALVQAKLDAAKALEAATIALQTVKTARKKQIAAQITAEQAANAAKGTAGVMSQSTAPDSSASVQQVANKELNAVARVMANTAQETAKANETAGDARAAAKQATRKAIAARDARAAAYAIAKQAAKKAIAAITAVHVAARKTVTAAVATATAAAKPPRAI